MQILLTIAAVINTILALVVLLKAKNKIQRVFSYLVFLIVIWIVVNYIYFLHPEYPFVNLSYTIGAFLIWMIFYWIYLFSKVRLSIWVHISAGLLSVISAIVTLLPDRFLSFHLDISRFGVGISKGDLYPVFAVFSTAIFVAALVLLVLAYKRSTGIERLQSRYVLFGFGAPIMIVIIVDFILPFVGLLWIVNLDSMTSFIFAGFIAYAINRYRFFDIKIILRKGVIQLFTYAILFAIYAYIVIILQRLVILEKGLSDQTTLILAVLTIGLTAEPLRRLIYSWIEKLFIGRKKNENESLKRLEIISRSNAQYEEILQETFQEMQKAVDGYDVILYRRDDRANTYISLLSQEESLTLNEAVINFMQRRMEFLVADEIPYQLYRFSNDEQMLLKSSHRLLEDRKIKAILPFGIEGNLIAFAFLKAKSKRDVLFREQIGYLKKIHGVANNALVQADMYKRALERAITS
ncbi:histidine kinase N-terminal 7TM domain-containing protein [Patescibacteria group bacterium]